MQRGAEMKTLLYIMIFFLCFVPEKEFNDKGKLTSISWCASKWRLLWGLIISIIIWRLI